MIKTQVQFPTPLYERLKEISKRHDWSLAEVMRKAAEHFVARFPDETPPAGPWTFPILDCGGDYKTDPARAKPEAGAMANRP